LFLEALGDALAIAEPLRTGREIVAWKANVFSPFAGVTLLYLAITLPLTHVARHLERRIDPDRCLSTRL
jgi:polar amino acid transport system permease protein